MGYGFLNMLRHLRPIVVRIASPRPMAVSSSTTAIHSHLQSVLTTISARSQDTCACNSCNLVLGSMNHAPSERDARQTVSRSCIRDLRFAVHERRGRWGRFRGVSYHGCLDREVAISRVHKNVVQEDFAMNLALSQQILISAIDGNAP